MAVAWKSRACSPWRDLPHLRINRLKQWRGLATRSRTNQAAAKPRTASTAAPSRTPCSPLVTA
ncbi:hypothetical protein, partial [Streptomyces decoyicus]|uniref:hypothetical protein n=1 Tax=Streptomyces decoyicus TaxID=249567 RepID=UPI0033BA50BF